MGIKRQSIRWNTVAILAGGFLGVILLGAFLLWLPVCNTQEITFFDALFTAASSVCVTGLVTVVPAVQFTLTGKIVLLILIQIGGLGIIGCAMLFVLIVRRKITVKERVLLKETYNSDAIGGIVGFVRRVLLGTFAVEAAGAVLYAIWFIPEYGVVRGIGYSIFHAVSSFCNAGIDILGEDSLVRYAANPLINITTMLLIILSGIGFTVWYDIIDNGKRIYKREVPGRWWFTRLKLHSKIALVTTLILIMSGTIAVLVMEYHNPETIGDMPLGQKIMASAFQSVTTRTAGFFTVPQGALHSETKLVSCILMFIGGSPGGTAGGVKTTTAAMLVLACITVIRGGQDTECFGRRITTANFRTGFSVAALAFCVYMCGTMLITMIEPDGIPVIDIMFETASALGTVGLTADLTSELSRMSQAVLILMMYIGRLGPMTLALLFVGKVNPRDRIRQLPSERIMIG